MKTIHRVAWLLLLFACSGSGNGPAPSTVPALTPLDANLMRAGKKFLAEHLESEALALKNARVSSSEDVAKFFEKVRAAGVGGEDLSQKPYPVTQSDHDFMVWQMAGTRICVPQIGKEIENWLIRWEAYHPKEDPACAIEEQHQAAIRTAASWGDWCKGEDPKWLECVKSRDAEFVCDGLRPGAWGALRNELPVHLQCK